MKQKSAGSAGGQFYDKVLQDALSLTVWDFATFKNFVVRDEAIVDVHGMYISAYPRGQWERYTCTRGLLRCSFSYEGQCEGLKLLDGPIVQSPTLYLFPDFHFRIPGRQCGIDVAPDTHIRELSMKKLLLATILVSAMLPLNAKTVSDETWSYSSSESRMVSGDATLLVRPKIVDVTPITSERLAWTKTIEGDEYSSRLSYFSNGTVNIEGSKLNMQTYVVYLVSTGKLAAANGKMTPCDVLMAPLFDMQFTEKGCVVNFSGYPAAYSKWENATGADVEVVRAAGGIRNSKSSAVNTNNLGVEQVEEKVKTLF